MRHPMLLKLRPICRNENMPVHASPPIVWTYRCLPNVKLGPRFGYGLEINKSIGPSCRDPDVHTWLPSETFGSGQMFRRGSDDGIAPHRTPPLCTGWYVI